jgi:hypothetical protein
VRGRCVSGLELDSGGVSCDAAVVGWDRRLLAVSMSVINSGR